VITKDTGIAKKIFVQPYFIVGIVGTGDPLLLPSVVGRVRIKPVFITVFRLVDADAGTERKVLGKIKFRGESS